MAHFVNFPSLLFVFPPRRVSHQPVPAPPPHTHTPHTSPGSHADDKHAHEDASDPGTKICYGKACYFTTALICAVGCAVAVVLGLAMAALTKQRYYVLYADIRTKKVR